MLAQRTLIICPVFLVKFTGNSFFSFASVNTTRNTLGNIGSHEDAVSCLKTSSHDHSLFSGSWDSYIRQWDVRTNSKESEVCCFDKVYSIDIHNDTLVAACANRRIYIFDIRKFREPIQIRESSLKYQTRCIANFSDGNLFFFSRFCVRFSRRKNFGRLVFSGYDRSESKVCV
jgi:WD40 repeat protein